MAAGGGSGSGGLQAARLLCPLRLICLAHLPPRLQEDFMNNCGVRTVLSTVLGAGMGVMFGVFMGTMDTVREGGAAQGGHHEAAAQRMRGCRRW